MARPSATSKASAASKPNAKKKAPAKAPPKAVRASGAKAKAPAKAPAKATKPKAKAKAPAKAKLATKAPAKAKKPAAGRAGTRTTEEDLARRLAETGTVLLSTNAMRTAAEAIVARGDALLFATADGDALSRTWHPLETPALDTLRVALARTGALFANLRPAKKKGPPGQHVAKEDVATLLAPVLEAFAPEVDPRHLDAAPILAALDELAQVGPPDTDAVSVPALVFFLTSSGAYRQPREALSAVVLAAGLGHVELLPDGGLGLLADVDADVCPKGPHGTPLRWARRPQAAFAARDERRPTSLPTSLPASRSTDAAAGLELERVDAWSAELFENEEPFPP